MFWPYTPTVTDWTGLGLLAIVPIILSTHIIYILLNYGSANFRLQCFGVIIFQCNNNNLLIVSWFGTKFLNITNSQSVVATDRE